MGLPAMVLSASFTVGALITYWSIVYQRAGFHVSSAGMVWLPIGVLAFIVSFITYPISRRTAEAAAEAIQRQFIEAPRNSEPVHEDAQ